MSKPSKLEEFTEDKARPLPVILLVDASGSMSVEGKIETLNQAVAEMLDSFSEQDDLRGQIHVMVIIFGGNEAIIHQELQPVSEVKWDTMTASGRTPMGGAFDLTLKVFEDREQIPLRAYRSTLVLVSDGLPTDEWREPLQRLLTSERGSQADRFALSIGDDADMEILETFADSSLSPIFEAHEIRKIKLFFRCVTEIIQGRLNSNDPNSVIRVDPDNIDANF